MKKNKIEKWMMKVDENFDMKKNYKLFRMTQKILNPTWHLKKKYEDQKIMINDHKLLLRIFNPFSDSLPHKIILFVHGGGWIAGSIKSYTGTCYDMAKKLNRIIIAIDYRLAPEHPYPAGFLDCYETIKTIFEHSKKLGLSPKGITLMGDSAGGNLVAAVSQKAHDTKDFKVHQQILLYPATQNDYSKTTKYHSVIENGEGHFLSRKQLEDFISLYLPEPEKRKDPYAAPILATHLFGLPKTLIVVGSKDPLRDEALEYGKKMRHHFVFCRSELLEGAPHGFLSNPLEKKYTTITYKKIQRFLGDKDE